VNLKKKIRGSNKKLKKKEKKKRQKKVRFSIFPPVASWACVGKGCLGIVHV